MNFKRLFYYLLLNIIVSGATTLIVLNIWDRTHQNDTIAAAPVVLLPTAMAEARPPTGTPLPEITLALRPYKVAPGETLGEIAVKFDTSIAQLLEINGLSNPDALSTGMILEVPASGSSENENTNAAQPEAPTASTPRPTTPPPPIPEDTDIKIVTIVGVDDLATEHLQIQSISSEALSLDGWRLETNDGLIYVFPKITLFEYGAVDLYSRAGINSVVALYWGRSNPIFESGDRAVIYDAEGNLQAVYNIP